MYDYPGYLPSTPQAIPARPAPRPVAPKPIGIPGPDELGIRLTEQAVVPPPEKLGIELK